MNSSFSTVIVICGPTAVGKTDFAIQLARYLNTEIISADSRQCYKELNIGVAKPSHEQLKAVPHHFINSHSVFDEVTAGNYERFALEKVADIFTRNPVAVMVGGTGLYIRAFCDGMDTMPATPAGVRNKLSEQYRAKGLEWLQQEVKQKDPAFWEIAEQHNPHRLIRALEIFESTGRSITTYRTAQEAKRNFNIKKIGLELPRLQLNERIHYRVNEMIDAGLIDEARTLFPLKDLNALQTVGYRELFDHFEGKMSLQNAIESIATHTRQYAKRQMTWFKKDAAINWFEADKVSVKDVLL